MTFIFSSIVALPVDPGLIIYNAPKDATQNTDYTVQVRKEEAYGRIYLNMMQKLDVIRLITLLMSISMRISQVGLK